MRINKKAPTWGAFLFVWRRSKHGTQSTLSIFPVTALITGNFSKYQGFLPLYTGAISATALVAQEHR